jgi:predicted RNA binding protein YcfA (HicA-like mRNA interferase family)
MATGLYRDVTKRLKSVGYVHIGNFKGSHEKWEGPDGALLCVPYNLKSKHTANGIPKDAGLEKLR